MYPCLPFVSPTDVAARRSRALATPKSMSLAPPSFPMRTFWGDTSRWTMPSGEPSVPRASCAAWSPRSTSPTTAAITPSGASSRQPSSAFASDSPSTYSMTPATPKSPSTTSNGRTTRASSMRAESRPSSTIAGAERGLLGQVGVESLDGDDPREPGGAHLLGEVHLRHTARADLRRGGSDRGARDWVRSAMARRSELERIRQPWRLRIGSPGRASEPDSSLDAIRLSAILDIRRAHPVAGCALEQPTGLGAGESQPQRGDRGYNRGMLTSKRAGIPLAWACVLTAAATACAFGIDVGSLTRCDGEGAACDAANDAATTSTDAPEPQDDSAALAPCPSGRGPAMVRVSGAPGNAGSFCVDRTEVTRGEYSRSSATKARWIGRGCPPPAGRARRSSPRATGPPREARRTIP